MMNIIACIICSFFAGVAAVQSHTITAVIDISFAVLNAMIVHRRLERTRNEQRKHNQSN